MIRHFLFVSSVAVPVAVLAILSPGHDAQATRNDRPLVTEPILLPTPDYQNAPLPAAQIEHNRRSVTVRPGDSLSTIFEQVGLGPSVMHGVLRSGNEAKALTRLKPGSVLRFDIGGGRLLRLDYPIDATTTLAVTARQDGYASTLEVKHPEARAAYAQGVIESSLYAAGLSAGLSDTLIMELAGIFGWDIDFALDIRAGDHFSVLYEEHFLNGNKLGSGTILAAEFVNNGRRHRAVRYTDATGRTDYYNAEGRSMRKAFLRSPVDFRRISSRFQSERYHPVLGVKRPHQGVDYAAATGTPIKAAGDGKVMFVGSKGGYGRTIIIHHGGHYSTLYGHLSRYQKGLSAGNRVRQGQTIGYVGQTGLATGPHLHYEFRVNGVHRNPLTVKLPNAAPIASAYKDDFERHASSILARLDLVNEVRLAAAER